jgi:hypothetical protein
MRPIETPIPELFQAVSNAFAASLINQKPKEPIMYEGVNCSFHVLEVAPLPSHLLVIHAMENNTNTIIIHKYEIRHNISESTRLVQKQIYAGEIPLDATLQPDMDFITKLIKNYDKL